ncbi:MAG: IS110 family transposase [Rhodothermaceae bacterium]|nr:IS110 family transposase [Rhodothermaceae bacterium]MYF63713.1 IS110 family transposase [Rhodothermaceae bacterium]
MQLVCESGDFTRFSGPTALMARFGMDLSHISSGNSIRRGSITKTGNRHARKALVSAAYKCTHCPRVSVGLRERQ